MQDGKYKVKAIDAGLGESQSGAVQPWVKFQTDGGETKTWYGNLNGSTPEKQQMASEITIKALVAAGFMGDDFSDLTKPFAIMFPNTPSCTISVKTEEYNGKSTQKIKGVFSESSAPKKFMGQAPKMAAAFSKARKQLGVTVTKTEDAPF